MSGARFTNATEAAHKLGVPIAWLRHEARAQRVPMLRAGRRMLFDVHAVAKALEQRAGRQVVPDAGPIEQSLKERAEQGVTDAGRG